MFLNSVFKLENNAVTRTDHCVNCKIFTMSLKIYRDSTQHRAGTW